MRAEGIVADGDDLRGFAQQGLLEAVDRYEPERGDFRRFAHYRVRGAMLDGLRKMGDWSRRGYERVALLRAADSACEAGAHADPEAPNSGEEAAERLRQHMAAVAAAVTLGVFADAGYEGLEVVARDPSMTAEQLLSERQLQARVREALAGLPEQEELVLRRHYVEGERLDAVAADLGLSKSWVSRIHTRALRRLGQRLRGLT
jgi:RNA polymerase sigma factor for flagellar operon FliA